MLEVVFVMRHSGERGAGNPWIARKVKIIAALCPGWFYNSQVCFSVFEVKDMFGFCITLFQVSILALSGEKLNIWTKVFANLTS